MKQEYVEQLKKGDFIKHKHYGLCIIDKVQLCINDEWFGINIRPLSMDSILKLINQSGVLFNRILETQNRLIISKVENPNIPKLIFKVKDRFEVHKWKELGEISNKGKFSSIKLKTFISLKEATIFSNSN